MSTFLDSHSWVQVDALGKVNHKASQECTHTSKSIALVIEIGFI